MTRKVRFKSDAVYFGDDALSIVEQMRKADFDPPDTVREYIVRAVARASHYFGITLRVDAQNGTEAEAAEKFLAESIKHSFAVEETAS